MLAVGPKLTTPPPPVVAMLNSTVTPSRSSGPAVTIPPPISASLPSMAAPKTDSAPSLAIPPPSAARLSRTRPPCTSTVVPAAARIPPPRSLTWPSANTRSWSSRVAGACTSKTRSMPAAETEWEGPARSVKVSVTSRSPAAAESSPVPGMASTTARGCVVESCTTWGPAKALASWMAARSEQVPTAVAQLPSPGTRSTPSRAVSTSKSTPGSAPPGVNGPNKPTRNQPASTRAAVLTTGPHPCSRLTTCTSLHPELRYLEVQAGACTTRSILAGRGHR